MAGVAGRAPGPPEAAGADELDAFYEKVIDDHLSKRGADASKGEDLVDVLLRLHGDPAHQSTFNSRDQIKGILTVRTLQSSYTLACSQVS